MDKRSDKMRHDGSQMRKMKYISSVLHPPGRYGGVRRANRLATGSQDGAQEGPRRPQDSSKKAQDEAKMAQLGASDSKLKPKGRNMNNLEQPKEKQCF